MANPTTITIGTKTYSLVPMPQYPAPRSVQFTMNDTVAASSSPFTLQTDTQTFPGADWWEGTVTLPPMDRIVASPWIAWLAQLRGQQCVFMLGDPDGTEPLGMPQGIPLVDGSETTNNTPTTTVLYTKGWTPNAHRLLMPNDYMQIGNRLYKSLDLVIANANGDAQINIWPSIRETPQDGTPITLRRTAGLFRLADNARSWNRDAARLYGISFKVTEVK